MIVDGDKRVSTAFLETLREEPSSAVMTALTRKSHRPDNVVKVDGLSAAIASVDHEIRERARSSVPPDIFDALVGTDDACGPAVYQPCIATPVPPAPSFESTIVIPRAPRVPAIILVDHDRPPPPLPILPDRPYSAAGWFAVSLLAPLALFFGILALVVLRHGEATAISPRVKQQPVFIGAKAYADPPLFVVDVKTLKPAPIPSKKKR